MQVRELFFSFTLLLMMMMIVVCVDEVVRRRRSFISWSSFYFSQLRNKSRFENHKITRIAHTRVYSPQLLYFDAIIIYSTFFTLVASHVSCIRLSRLLIVGWMVGWLTTTTRLLLRGITTISYIRESENDSNFYVYGKLVKRFVEALNLNLYDVDDDDGRRWLLKTTTKDGSSWWMDEEKGMKLILFRFVFSFSFFIRHEYNCGKFNRSNYYHFYIIIILFFITYIGEHINRDVHSVPFCVYTIRMMMDVAILLSFDQLFVHSFVCSRELRDREEDALRGWGFIGNEKLKRQKKNCLKKIENENNAQPELSD